MNQQKGLIADGIALFFLCAVAVAHPLYDVLSRGAEFFVDRRSPPIDVLALVAILSVLLPSALVTLLALADRLSRPARKVLHSIAASVLFSMIYLPVFKTLKYLPAVAVVVAAGAAGAACGLALVRWQLLRHRYFMVPASLAVIDNPH